MKRLTERLRAALLAFRDPDLVYLGITARIPPAEDAAKHWHLYRSGRTGAAWVVLPDMGLPR